MHQPFTAHTTNSQATSTLNPPPYQPSGVSATLKLIRMFSLKRKEAMSLFRLGFPLPSAHRVFSFTEKEKLKNNLSVWV